MFWYGKGDIGKMRLRKKVWAVGEIETNSLLIAEAETLKGKWKNEFGNDNPIRLEIGCGKGRFVCGMAEKNKNVNFVALERAHKIIAMGARDARLAEIENVRFINNDAMNIGNYFEESELELVYINFCDPWRERAKWAKRRLTHRGFLEVYRKLLTPNGAVFFKTDNEPLFNFSVSEFTKTGWNLNNVTRDLYEENKGDATFAEWNVQTEYEKKFVNSGLKINRLEAYK